MNESTHNLKDLIEDVIERTISKNKLEERYQIIEHDLRILRTNTYLTSRCDGTRW